MLPRSLGFPGRLLTEVPPRVVSHPDCSWSGDAVTGDAVTGDVCVCVCVCVCIYEVRTRHTHPHSSSHRRYTAFFSTGRGHSSEGHSSTQYWMGEGGQKPRKTRLTTDPPITWSLLIRDGISDKIWIAKVGCVHVTPGPRVTLVRRQPW